MDFITANPASIAPCECGFSVFQSFGGKTVWRARLTRIPLNEGSVTEKVTILKMRQL